MTMMRPRRFLIALLVILTKKSSYAFDLCTTSYGICQSQRSPLSVRSGKVSTAVARGSHIGVHVRQHVHVGQTSWAHQLRHQSLSGRMELTKAYLNIGGFDDDLSTSPPFLLIAGVALVLLVSAQTFINQLLEGDEGLGAYLKDGTGYNRSSFGGKSSSFKNQDDSAQDDPLPWLKLPQLDFVDVAGQEKQPPLQDAPSSLAGDESLQSGEISIYQRLEKLRSEMNEELQKGDISKATALKNELEQLMKVNGIEYKN